MFLSLVEFAVGSCWNGWSNVAHCFKACREVRLEDVTDQNICDVGSKLGVHLQKASEAEVWIVERVDKLSENVDTATVFVKPASQLVC